MKRPLLIDEKVINSWTKIVSQHAEQESRTESIERNGTYVYYPTDPTKLLTELLINANIKLYMISPKIYVYPESTIIYNLPEGFDYISNTTIQTYSIITDEKTISPKHIDTITVQRSPNTNGYRKLTINHDYSPRSYNVYNDGKVQTITAEEWETISYIHIYGTSMTVNPNILSQSLTSCTVFIFNYGIGTPPLEIITDIHSFTLTVNYEVSENLVYREFVSTGYPVIFEIGDRSASLWRGGIQGIMYDPHTHIASCQFAKGKYMLGAIATGTVTPNYYIIGFSSDGYFSGNSTCPETPYYDNDEEVWYNLPPGISQVTTIGKLF